MGTKWEAFRRNLFRFKAKQSAGVIVAAIAKIEEAMELKPVESEEMVFTGKWTSGKEYEIRYRPDTNVIAVLTSYDQNGTLVRTGVRYFFEFLDNRLIVHSERIDNYYLQNDNDYLVVVKSMRRKSGYNEDGFQIFVVEDGYRFPRMLHVSSENVNDTTLYAPDLMRIPFKHVVVSANKIRTTREYNVVTKPRNYEFESVAEKDPLSVLYTDADGTKVSFPLFYNDDKTIIVDTFDFLGNPLLQNPFAVGTKWSGEKISFEGRTVDDAEEYIAARAKVAAALIKSGHREEEIFKLLLGK